jgi:hypothetical protein
MKDEKNKVTLENFVKGFYDGNQNLMIDIMAKRITHSKR